VILKDLLGFEKVLGYKKGSLGFVMYAFVQSILNWSIEFTCCTLVRYLYIEKEIDIL